MTFSRIVAAVVPVLDLEVALEQVDDRQVAGRLAVGDGARLQDEPAVDAMGVRDLPDEPRLPDPRLPDEGDHLAVAGAGPLEGLAKLLQLGLPPDEAGEAARGGGVQPGARRPGPDQLVHLDRRRQALHRHRAERLDLDVALGEARACRR